MNYIDRLAQDIYTRAHPRGTQPPEDRALYRLYAVLCLVKGKATTNEDVHTAWSAWRAETFPGHRSLIPFAELSPEVQAMDEPYTKAIREAAGAIRGE